MRSKSRKAEVARAWTEQRKQAGLCVQCGNTELSSAVLCADCLEQRRVRGKVEVQRRKRTVLAYYGKRCACCGEMREEFLTIDHVDNNGASHRKQLGVTSGSSFYRWLIKNGFPSGFQTLCWNCNCAKSRRGYCPHEVSQAKIVDDPLSTSGTDFIIRRFTSVM